VAEVEFSGEVVEWRGPAPFHFLVVPAEGSEVLRRESAVVSYGWGMIPADCEIGEVRWRTSLWPKDGRYLIPLKDAVRRAAGIALGDEVEVRVRTAGPRGPADRDALVALVRRIQAGEAATEAEEEDWLARLERSLPGSRVVDLVLLGDPELGALTPEQVVDIATARRAGG